MIKLLLLVCISVSSMNSLRISELAKKTLSEKYHVRWAEWKEKFYPGEGDFTEVDNEESLVKFEANNKTIDDFNANKEKNGYTFTKACGKYCCKDKNDMISHEGHKAHDQLNIRPEMHLLREKSLVVEDMMKSKYPYKILPESTADEVNHITLGNDATPKNQGSCGSCWAFSAITVIESAFKIAGGDLLNLSEQHLVDCDTTSYGCEGGFEDYAVDWASKNGVILDKDYPYKAKGGSCKGSSDKYVKGYKVDQMNMVPNYDETQLAAAIYYQPVTVAVDAGTWYLYEDGIWNDHNDCAGQLNHAVAAVGYGSENGEKYWIIKNSWGTGWGEAGYIRLQKDVGFKEGMCGVAMLASYPSVTVTAEPTGDDSNEDQSGPVAPVDPKCKECSEKNWPWRFHCVVCKLNNAITKKNLSMTNEEINALAEELYGKGIEN